MKGPKPSNDPPKIRVGISLCLLGEKVRFDGGHKHDSLITGVLGRFFEWVPVCPEVEIGLGTPRESLRLVGSPEKPRLVAAKSGTDHTRTMQEWANLRLEEMSSMHLHGYIFKKDSPSCGMERVRVYRQAGGAQRVGSGIFARALLDRFTTLPVEEEGRLRDIRLRENFVERVFAHHRWTEFASDKPRQKDLVEFHTRQKLTLSSHSGPHYQKLGRLVAQAGKMRMHELLSRYGELFMEALRVKATTRKHSNVLYHLLGYLKRDIEPMDKEELVATIEDYRRGLIPLIVPMTLLLHHFRRHPHPWVMEQTYLNPYPAELTLRNQI